MTNVVPMPTSAPAPVAAAVELSTEDRAGLARSNAAIVEALADIGAETERHQDATQTLLRKVSAAREDFNVRLRLVAEKYERGFRPGTRFVIDLERGAFVPLDAATVTGAGDAAAAVQKEASTT